MKKKICNGAVLTDKRLVYELIEVPKSKKGPVITLVKDAIAGAYIPLAYEKQIGQIIQRDYSFFKSSAVITFEKFLEYDKREKDAYQTLKDLKQVLGINTSELFVKLARENKDGIQVRLTTEQAQTIIKALS